jgi:hypothetical protein
MIDFRHQFLDKVVLFDHLAPTAHLAAVETVSTTVACPDLLLQKPLSKTTRKFQGPQNQVPAFWILHDLGLAVGAEGV